MPIVVNHTPAGVIQEMAHRTGQAEFAKFVRERDTRDQQINAKSIADAALRIRQDKQEARAQQEFEHRVQKDNSAESMANKRFIQSMDNDAAARADVRKKFAEEQEDSRIRRLRDQAQTGSITAKEAREVEIWKTQKAASERAEVARVAAVADRLKTKTNELAKAVKKNPGKWSKDQIKFATESWVNEDSKDLKSFQEYIESHIGADPATQKAAQHVQTRKNIQNEADAENQEQEQLMERIRIKRGLRNDPLYQAEQTNAKEAAKKSGETYIDPINAEISRLDEQIDESNRREKNLRSTLWAMPSVPDTSYIEDNPRALKTIHEIEAENYEYELSQKDPPVMFDPGPGTQQAAELERRVYKSAERKGWLSQRDRDPNAPEVVDPSAAKETPESLNVEKDFTDQDKELLERLYAKVAMGKIKELSQKERDLLNRAMLDPVWSEAHPPPEDEGKDTKPEKNPSPSKDDKERGESEKIKERVQLEKAIKDAEARGPGKQPYKMLIETIQSSIDKSHAELDDLSKNLDPVEDADRIKEIEERRSKLDKLRDDMKKKWEGGGGDIGTLGKIGKIVLGFRQGFWKWH